MNDKKTTLEVIAPSVEEAVENGLDQLGLPRDAVKVEVSIEGRDADDVIVKYEERANGLEITTEYQSKKRNQSRRPKLS